MNYGTFGFPGGGANGQQGSARTPFQGQQRRWNHAKLITTSTNTEKVPDGVYRLGIAVAGGGANGDANGGGGGGGFAFGIFSVVPGSLLLPITVGSSGGTSSYGALLSATGGSGQLGGAGSTAPSVADALTANGGAGGAGGGGGGGGGGGSFYGDGGPGGDGVGSRCGGGGGFGPDAHGASAVSGTAAGGGNGSCGGGGVVNVPSLSVHTIAFGPGSAFGSISDPAAVATAWPNVSDIASFDLYVLFANKALFGEAENGSRAAGPSGGGCNFRGGFGGGGGGAFATNSGLSTLGTSSVFGGGGGGSRGTTASVGADGGMSGGGGGAGGTSNATYGAGGAGYCLLVWE